MTEEKASLTCCKDLITGETVAEILDTTTNALAVMRCRGVGPRYVKLNERAIRYFRADVEKWIQDRLVETSDSVYAKTKKHK